MIAFMLILGGVYIAAALAHDTRGNE